MLRVSFSVQDTCLAMDFVIVPRKIKPYFSWHQNINVLNINVDGWVSEKKKKKLLDEKVRVQFFEKIGN